MAPLRLLTKFLVLAYVGTATAMVTKRAGWTSTGCYTDSAAARTLPYGAAVPGGPTAMTVELCQTACQVAGYKFAGVEYGAECFCGNALQNGGGPAPDGNAQCNMPCAGNSGERCGGPNRLNLYTYTTGTTTTTTAAPPSGTGGNPLPGWTFKGCYTDNGAARALPNMVPVSGSFTNENCQSACSAAGYSIAGTEYAAECWCGNAIANGAGPAPDGSAQCNMACKGNAAQTCGGPNRLSLYSKTTTTNPPTSYTLKATFDHTNFFSTWDFFTEPDPTHGYVNYLSQANAQAAGLINTNNNQVYMGVDYTELNPSAGRKSVRLVTKAAWTRGLFIADIAHMPAAVCGSWPAWWMTGPNWPYNGEIDMVEGVNLQTTNAMTLHTSAGCIVNTSGSLGSSSSISSPDCNNNNAYNGCGVTSGNTQSYGTGFNNIGGGVHAMRWTSTGIAIWFFPRNAIPADINNNVPNPSSWGTPVVIFNGGAGCDIDAHFSNMQMVFDTTFCGDYAGNSNVWAQSSCSAQASNCQTYVANNPAAFRNVYWAINSVKVYQ